MRLSRLGIPSSTATPRLFCVGGKGTQFLLRSSAVLDLQYVRRRYIWLFSGNQFVLRRLHRPSFSELQMLTGAIGNSPPFNAHAQGKRKKSSIIAISTELGRPALILARHRARSQMLIIAFACVAVRKLGLSVPQCCGGTLALCTCSSFVYNPRPSPCKERSL